MGHLTEIANSLQAVAARRPAVARTLCSNAAWTDFAFGPLAERNQVASPASSSSAPTHSASQTATCMCNAYQYAVACTLSQELLPSDTAL